jgi:hypothetical protein
MTELKNLPVRNDAAGGTKFIICFSFWGITVVEYPTGEIPQETE